MKLFVDTSAWLALHDRNDKYFAEASEKSLIIKKEKIEIITSGFILDESITIIRVRVSHQAAVLFGDSLLTSKIVKIINIEGGHISKAWNLFNKYKDKTLSFTDCTSFVLIKETGVQKVFTFDDHFRQGGFEIF
jgi:predicted nucleic acid-binding protein